MLDSDLQRVNREHLRERAFQPVVSNAFPKSLDSRLGSVGGRWAPCKIQVSSLTDR